MSEAVNPNHDSASPRSDVPNSSAVPESEPVPAMAVAESEEDWQTVDFPGAIPLADLLQSSVLTEETSGATASVGAITADKQESLESAAQESENLQNLVQYLRGENSSLRNQIVQLEQDLAQVQVELQLEVARFYCKQPEDGAAGAATDTTDELMVAKTQIQQLTQSLEQSQQTVQQQQQLVDALTEQLATSQERIAQLERDCALSQQRYAEQVQLATQMDNTCRDLRMRLHRQQQQTLQFKAALEKSLEMAPVISSDHIISSEPLTSSPNAEHPESAAFLPKAQPVKPWSKTPESPSIRSHPASPRSLGQELPNLLKLFHADMATHSHPSDVLGSEESSGDPATPPAELLALTQSAIAPESPSPSEAEPPDLDALFPDVPPLSIAAEACSQAAIFDLSPFVEAGEVDPATITASHLVAPTEASDQSPASEPPTPTPSPTAASEPPPIPLPENNLWADLARLIEPDMVAENAATAPDLTIEVESQAIEPTPTSQRSETLEVNERPVQASGDRARSAKPAPSPQTDNPFVQPFVEAPWVAEMQSGSPFITVKSPTESQRAAIAAYPDPPIPTVNSLEPATVESSPGLPSPVLHRFRPAKRLKSMASVELPNFPRTAEQQPSTL